MFILTFRYSFHHVYWVTQIMCCAYIYTQAMPFFLFLLLLWRSGQLLWSMFWLSELTNLIKMTSLDMHTRNSGWIKKKSTGQQGLYHRVCTEKSFQNSQTVYKPFRKPHLLIIHKIGTKSYPSIWTKWRKLVVKQGDGKGRGAWLRKLDMEPVSYTHLTLPTNHRV